MDKWIKSEKERDKDEKKKEPKKKETSAKNKSKLKAFPQEDKTSISPEKPKIKLSKHVLICPKKSCGYQKTLMKKQLNEKDKICPRCRSVMKIKKS